MTDLKQAAQMALEALRYPLDTSAKLFDADKAELMNLRAINALRKALEEQPEKYTFGTPLLDLFKVSPGQIVHADAVAEPQTTHWEGCEAVHPECRKPEQQPVSLNNGRLTQYPDGSIGVGTPAEPEQEPVAWVVYDTDNNDIAWSETGKRLKAETPLYTAPTPRKPLTDEQCDSILLALDEWAKRFDHYDYGLPLYNEELRGKAREVMRIAHGITGETK